MDEKEKSELKLEDIMMEFQTGDDETPDEEIKQWTARVFGEKQAPVQETSEETVAEMEPEEVDEPTLRMDPVSVPVPPAEVTGDTIRLDTVKIREEAAKSVTSDTIRLDTALIGKAEVRNATRILNEDEVFSDKWEPDYDQPMGEYTPAQQIIAHPRSRLRELKKKLVAGPEKRYYELAESGFGKLQAAIFFSLVVVLISATTTALYALDLIRPERMKLMIFAQLLAMMVSALLGSNQMLEGLGNLFRKRFSLNTLLALTFVVCLVDGVFCLIELRVPCCAAFSLEMTMSLWSAYQRRNTEMGQMDTMRRATHLESIVAHPDYYDGKKGFLPGRGEVEDFMDTYRQLPKPAKRLDRYALIAAVLSLATGITAGVLKGISGNAFSAVSAGFQVFAVTLLAAVPVSSFIAISRPMGILEKKLHGVGAVLCGWQGVEELSGKAVFPLNFEDLFPAGSCRMNGVKFYGSREPDEIVSYCTALMEAENGGLASLFTQVLDSRNAIRYNASSLVRYDGGIGALVEGEQVLVGSLSFLRGMGVETPDVRVNQAVCVAIEGEFSGLFAVTMDRFKGATEGINTVFGQRGLNPVLTACDFVLTESFIRGKLKVNTKRLHMPDKDVRAELTQVEPDEKAQALALVTTEGLPPYAYAVAGARTLRSCTWVGTLISMIGGGLGIAMMLALTLLGALQYLTPANMFLYQLVWLIPGLLITEWTRNI